MPRGGKRPGAGRKPGALNKRAGGVEAWARSVVEDPLVQARLLADAQQGALAPPLMALMFHYAYGRPSEQARDDEVFITDLLAVVLTHVGSPQARREIEAVIDAHTTGGSRLSAVA